MKSIMCKIAKEILEQKKIQEQDIKNSEYVKSLHEGLIKLNDAMKHLDKTNTKKEVIKNEQ